MNLSMQQDDEASDGHSIRSTRTSALGAAHERSYCPPWLPPRPHHAPLIGGSVALIGSPSAAAVSITPAMLATYSAWLWYERKALMHASGFGRDTGDFIPCINPIIDFHFPRHFRIENCGLDAQARTPVILAAAGCRLTSAEAEEQWATTFRLAARQIGN